MRPFDVPPCFARAQRRDVQPGNLKPLNVAVYCSALHCAGGALTMTTTRHLGPPQLHIRLADALAA
jgi:hypothetical protein